MRLSDKTASELSKMLRNKECSSVEICQDVFDKISENEDNIKAYVTLNKEKAIETAKKADEGFGNGEDMPVMAGIPMSVKDNISTKGLRTTCSSKMLENYVPPFDATVVKNIEKNVVPVIGKTNMDEFAMGSSTETSYFQITKNPRNTECVPGGSSGGAAASVASKEAVVAIGSDTGGSIRQPAAFCGVVGLKPTYGSVSRYGLVAFASSLDQIGPIARSVEDTAILQDVISSYDTMDATSCDMPYGNLYKNLSENIKGLKVGIPAEYFGEGIGDEIKTNVMNTIKVLEKNGAEIVDISLPSTKYAINTYYILASAEASSNLSRFDGVRYGFRAPEYKDLNDMYVKTRSQGFGDEVKRRIMLGTFVLSSGFYDAYYKKAKKTQQLIISEFNDAFKKCDIIATPTTPTTAFKIGANINDPIKMYYNDVCTVPVNIAGLPAVSMPCAYSSDKLPISIQFIGKHFDEQTILNAAYSLEKIIGNLC